MAEEYVPRATFRKWLKLDDDDSEDNTLVDIALAGAVKWIHETTGRQFTLDAEPSARTYRGSGRTWWTNDGLHALVVNDIGSMAGLVIEVGSTASGWSTVSGVDTSPDNALADGRPITALLRSVGWPCGGAQRVRVTARWGWPAVPDDVVQACLIQAARLYRRKDSPEGVMGSTEWGVVRVTRVDPDAKALLDPLCLPGFA